MKEDYVSYELAKKLKACGFYEPCDHYYCAFDNETDVWFWSKDPAQSQNGFTNPDDKVIADAPTLAHAQKWLREVKEVNVLVFDCACGYGWNISKAGDEQKRGTMMLAYDEQGEDENSGMWLSYESALAAGIEAALKLINTEP